MCMITLLLCIFILPSLLQAQGESANGMNKNTAFTIQFNPSLAAAGWRLSPTHGWSCDQVCSAEGLSCSETGQHTHNADVSTESGMARILSKFGKTCSQYNLNYRTARGVPNQDLEGTCFISSMSRTAEQYNCTNGGGSGGLKSRLCWCDIPGLLQTN